MPGAASAVRFARTLRWRKTDSNLWSHFQRGQRFGLAIRFPGRRHRAASVLISENDDFAFPAAKVTSLAEARASGSVSACASWRIPVVMGYAPGCFRGMKRDAVPGMSINGGQASV